MAKQKNTMP